MPGLTMSVPMDLKIGILYNGFCDKISETSKYLVSAIGERRLGDLNFSEINEYAKMISELYNSINCTSLAPRYDQNIDKHVELGKKYTNAFGVYGDLLLINRALQIARWYDPVRIDTIIGIDRSGRSYAKLVKGVFDSIRQNKNVPEINLIFLNIHDTKALMSSQSELMTDIDPNYGNNYLFKGRKYGKVLAIDDWTSGSGGTRRRFGDLMWERNLSEYDTEAQPVGYEYFDRSRPGQQCDPIGHLNQDFAIGGWYLRTSHRNKRPSLFSAPGKSKEKLICGETLGEHKPGQIRAINHRISQIGGQAAKIYLNSELGSRSN